METFPVLTLNLVVQISSSFTPHALDLHPELFEGVRDNKQTEIYIFAKILIIIIIIILKYLWTPLTALPRKEIKDIYL